MQGLLTEADRVRGSEGVPRLCDARQGWHPTPREAGADGIARAHRELELWKWGHPPRAQSQREVATPRATASW